MTACRVLLAAAQESAAQRLTLEMEALSLLVVRAADAPEAREKLSEGEYAILVICLPLPGDGAALAMDAARNTAGAVLLIAKEEMGEERAICEARDAGAIFLQKPLSRERLALALESAVCLHRRIVFLQRENALLQRKMQEMRSVERAKYLLMQTLGMTEPQAHRFIEKQAMDARQTRAEVAMRILKTYENT